MEESFQFDYFGYLKSVSFLIILMGIMAYILIKLKGRGKFPFTLASLSTFQATKSGNQQIRIIERCVLEARKNLYVVQIFENQYWLIGTTETEITNLGPLKPPYYRGEGFEYKQTKAFAEYMEDHETKTTD